METFKALFKLYFAYYIQIKRRIYEKFERFITPIRLAREKKRLRAKGYFIENEIWAGFFGEFDFCKCFIIKKILFPNFYAVKNSSKWQVESAHIALKIGIFAYDEIAWIFVPQSYDENKKNDLEKIQTLLGKFPKIRYEMLENGIKIYGYEI